MKIDVHTRVAGVLVYEVEYTSITLIRTVPFWRRVLQAIWWMFAQGVP